MKIAVRCPRCGSWFTCSVEDPSSECVICPYCGETINISELGRFERKGVAFYL